MGELTKEMCQCVDMDCIKDVLEGVEPLEQFIEREDEDVLMHLHTSGTTGMPKTVRYTKGTVYAGTDYLCTFPWL